MVLQGKMIASVAPNIFHDVFFKSYVKGLSLYQNTQSDKVDVRIMRKLS